LQTAKVRERFSALAVDPMPMSAVDFSTFVHNEIALNAALVQKVGIKSE
jgi:hypothetical protein